jgi:uncharacterized protein (DUF2336 family)
MDTSQSIIAELEDAIRDGSPDKRAETLRRATDLFLSEAARLTESQISVFDDVLTHLIKKIETKAKAELSLCLAPLDKAPIELIRQLARDDEIAVAEPVLAQSPRLTNNDLIEVAKNKSQQHLLAITGRSELEEPVTDVLVSRGNRDVKYKLAGNAGARFSETGFTSLVNSAENDESLTERIGLRIDLPPRLLRPLLLKATAAVRARLVAVAPAETRDVIQQMVSEISKEVYLEIAPARDFSQALETINSMQKQGSLNEATLLAFANARSYEETVAALGALCSTSVEFIEPLITSTDGLLVVCKAARLNWLTAKALLQDWILRRAITESAETIAEKDYFKLSEASAQRTLGFWKTRIEAS